MIAPSDFPPKLFYLLKTLLLKASADTSSVHQKINKDATILRSVVYPLCSPLPFNILSVSYISRSILFFQRTKCSTNFIFNWSSSPLAPLLFALWAYGLAFSKLVLFLRLRSRSARSASNCHPIKADKIVRVSTRYSGL